MTPPSGADPLAAFGVDLRFNRSQVVVAPIGEVDLATATELGDVLKVAIAWGTRGVVLDLSECTFLDAAGLGAIAMAARQLRLLPASNLLFVRSPSALVLRILAITGLHEVVTVEAPVPPITHLAGEQARGMGTGARIHADTAALALMRLTAIPADRDVVDGALRLVVALARATVNGADGVSVSLNRRGRLSTVAASDQTILDMDADQHATGEGPCVDASIEGRWFYVESLETESRWPAFVPRARTLGINAILSNPLVVGGKPVGALNIYSNTPRAFEVKDERLASVFATEASTILTGAGAAVTDEQLARRLGEALESREAISLAQGIVMKREGISAQAAYLVLLDSSRRSNQPVRALAADIVASTHRSELPVAVPVVKHSA